MKKIFSFAILALTLFVSACKQDDVMTDDYRLSAEELVFAASGGSMELSVRTSADVSAVSDASWCTVSEVYLNSDVVRKFLVTAAPLDLAQDRTAALTLTIGSETAVVNVTQKGVAMIVPETSYEIESSAHEFEIEVEASVSYSADTDAQWLDVVSEDADGLLMSAEENPFTFPRTAVVTITAGLDSFDVTVVQVAASGAAPDKTGMESDAKTLMKKMHLGINLGNTLEAIGGETAWGAPRTTEAIIRYFKELGFNAVRIPCSWNQNLEAGEGYIVKSSWMNRVKEVVDYVVDNDMYAVLNIHWDEGWLENDIPNGYDEAVDAQQRAIWTQIATAFRNYDEHLVFAGTNEPNVEDADDMAVLLRYEQTFIDAVRATGGKNAYRVLVFQGPSTDVDRTVELMHQLPEDKVEGRLAAEVHYYTPYQFCGLGQDEWWGKMQFFWGEETKDYAVGAYVDRWVSDYGNEEYLAGQMEKMKTKFWDNGIPVIIGEFGAVSDRKMDLGTPEENLKAEEGYRKSLALYNGGVVREAKAHGCVPFFWHCEDDMIDRSGLKVTDQARLDAIVEAGNTQYPD